MKKVSLIMCNDMHMDIERANELLTCISKNQDYEIITDYTKADIVIINTCAFGMNKEYSIYVIADVQKNVKENTEIIVTGDLEKSNKKELEAIPGIKVEAFSKVKEFFGNNHKTSFLIPQNKVIISKGCLKKCSYCIYPLIENKYESKPIEQVLEEVEKIYEKEVVIYITGELETSDYGIDLYGKRNFAELLDQICTKYPKANYVIGWFHPAGLTDEVLSVIQKHKNIMEIMVHIQHVSKNILKDMNRPTFEYTDSKLKKLRHLRPDIMISTEVIVGFPGETTRDVMSLMDYLDSKIFCDIGVASYEPVYGTKAATMTESFVPKDERIEIMNFIKNRYNCTAYPYTAKDFLLILEAYMEANKKLSKIPNMILNFEERQEYEFVAGTDTKVKMNFGELVSEMFEKICNARDKISIEKLSRYAKETYTEEFRKYLIKVFENSETKPMIIEKAKTILL